MQVSVKVLEAMSEDVVVEPEVARFPLHAPLALHDDAFVASDPPAHVVFARDLGEEGPDRSEQAIAGAVAVEVVDRLQPADVEEHDRQGPPVTPRPPDLGCQPALQRSTRQQPCERVDCGERLELGELPSSSAGGGGGGRGGGSEQHGQDAEPGERDPHDPGHPAQQLAGDGRPGPRPTNRLARGRDRRELRGRGGRPRRRRRREGAGERRTARCGGGEAPWGGEPAPGTAAGLPSGGARGDVGPGARSGQDPLRAPPARPLARRRQPAGRGG